MTVPVPAHPRDLRRLVAAGEWTAPTAGILDDYQQANLLVVPSAAADDFAEYCRRNPEVCPLLARTAPGNPELTYDNCTVDIRTMLPRYRVWQHDTLVAEPTDLIAYWRDDAVAFALGCSHTSPPYGAHMLAKPMRRSASMSGWIRLRVASIQPARRLWRHWRY
ncbi:hypothetical protein C8E05_7021 [Rhodococcus wratislaviensis]|uniref:Uncharacterized conserved protein n=1 Tax=Rhodococcus wratislaviensis TaxID=44752 RepID=A0AB38F7C7_RHOWR|nr:hypothetical protein [Rhodococcus wratislaviensis]REE77501.1 hypothetical protein C8E05_7021 [Rhodococcus wratislaviensis]SPZ35388.1 Uncharacterized conserved protein [Rhodococcus wratislaviensis]